MTGRAPVAGLAVAGVLLALVGCGGSDTSDVPEGTAVVTSARTCAVEVTTTGDTRVVWSGEGSSSADVGTGALAGTSRAVYAAESDDPATADDLRRLVVRVQDRQPVEVELRVGDRTLIGTGRRQPAPGPGAEEPLGTRLELDAVRMRAAGPDRLVARLSASFACR